MCIYIWYDIYKYISSLEKWLTHVDRLPWSLPRYQAPLKHHLGAVPRCGTVDGSDIRRENHLGCIFFKNPVNNGISYQPQLVISSINSMTYRSISFEDSFLRCFCKVNPRRCQRKVRLLGMLDPLLNCNPPGHWYWENILRQTRGFGEPRSNRPRAVRSKKTSLPNRIFATCRARSTPLLPMLSSRGQARP